MRREPAATIRPMALGILSMLGVVSLWSITPTLMKIALQGFQPFSVAFIRLVLGATVLLSAYLARRGTLKDLFKPNGWALLGAAGITVNYTFFCFSLQHTTAGAGGLVVQIQFVTLAVLAAVLLKERFNALKLLGMGSVIGGIVMVIATQGNLQTAFAADYRFGNLLMLVSGIGWGFYAVSNKALTVERATLPILIPFMLLAAIPTGIGAVIGRSTAPVIPVESIVAILVLGVASTGVGFFLISTGMRRLSAGLAGTITGITPLFNLFVAHWVLGEPLSPYLILSGVLIFAGLAGIVQAERLGAAARS